MKKLLIPILAFSLYSCTTTKQVEEYGCDLSEHNVGYHIHSGTYVENGKTKIITRREARIRWCLYRKDSYAYR